VSNIALYAYARLRMAAHRVVSATDPGEEKRLGSALFELAEELAHLDQIDGLLREYAPDEDVPPHPRTRPTLPCPICRAKGA
jgi:hypothetical protein